MGAFTLGSARRVRSRMVLRLRLLDVLGLSRREQRLNASVFLGGGWVRIVW